VLFWWIVVPLVVAGGTSLALVRRETAAAAGSVVRHPPSATGFGRGGRPVPVESNGDAGLATLLEPPIHRPLWVRSLRVLALAMLMVAAAAVIAGAIFEIGKWVGDALKSFATGSS
jgi:hypothetical protein